VAELLRPLTWAGYALLVDRCIPGTDGNIDLVLIGPPGVFVVDAKNWSGRIEVRDNVVRQNDRPRPGVLDQARRQALVVASMLEDLRPSASVVPVRPVTCFVGQGRLSQPVAVERTHLLNGPDLVLFVMNAPPTMTPEGVNVVAEELDRRLAPRTAVVEHAGDPGSAIPPAEPIVYLEPWNRYGKRRLYVKDEFGTQGGHLDLVDGSLVTELPVAEPVLRQLLPHYVSGEMGGGSDDGISEQDLGAIRRFLQRFVGSQERRTPVREELEVVVGNVWRNHGKQRLYVHRLAPGVAKVQLGWFDLKEQRVHADVPGTEPEIRYCGQQYLTTRPQS
jgi:hypothetical protein